PHRAWAVLLRWRGASAAAQFWRPPAQPARDRLAIVLDDDRGRGCRRGDGIALCRRRRTLAVAVPRRAALSAGRSRPDDRLAARKRGRPGDARGPWSSSLFSA